MTTKERQESCLVTYDQCDGCFKEVRVEARVGDERFDPRSRTGGYHSLRLWPDHPWDGKSVCPLCRRDRVWMVPGVPPVDIHGMRKVTPELQNPNPRGTEPCSAKYWDSALVVVEMPSVTKAGATSRLAVPLHKRESYWVPTVGRIGRECDDWLIEVMGGARVRLLVAAADGLWRGDVKEVVCTEAHVVEAPYIWGAEVCARLPDPEWGQVPVLRLLEPSRQEK